MASPDLSEALAGRVEAARHRVAQGFGQANSPHGDLPVRVVQAVEGGIDAGLLPHWPAVFKARPWAPAAASGSGEGADAAVSIAQFCDQARAAGPQQQGPAVPLPLGRCLDLGKKSIGTI